MPNYTTRPWREYTAVDGHLGAGHPGVREQGDDDLSNLFWLAEPAEGVQLAKGFELRIHRGSPPTYGRHGRGHHTGQHGVGPDPPRRELHRQAAGAVAVPEAGLATGAARALGARDERPFCGSAG